MIKCIVNASLADDATERSIELADKLLDALENSGIMPPPRLLNLALTDDSADEWECEVGVKLATGLVLPLQCGLLELEDAPLTDDAIVAEVMEGIMAVEPHLRQMQDLLHDTRVASRKAVARFIETGARIRFVDVQLAPYDHWRGCKTPALELLVENLGDTLEPIVDRIWLEGPSAIETELQAHLAVSEGLTSDLRRAMEAGASGTIDQLAINAMAHAGPIEDHILRLREEPRFWLPDDTCISVTRGHVTAGSGVWIGVEKGPR